MCGLIDGEQLRRVQADGAEPAVDRDKGADRGVGGRVHQNRALRPAPQPLVAPARPIGAHRPALGLAPAVGGEEAGDVGVAVCHAAPTPPPLPPSAGEGAGTRLLPPLPSRQRWERAGVRALSIGSTLMGLCLQSAPGPRPRPPAPRATLPAHAAASQSAAPPAAALRRAPATQPEAPRRPTPPRARARRPRPGRLGGRGRRGSPSGPAARTLATA